MFKAIFAVMILIGRTPYATCQTAANVKALRTKLFTTDGYEPRVRPIDDQSLPIAITVDLYLLAINDLSEVSETLKTTAFLGLGWEDAFLRWTPASYNKTEYAFWPQGDVWKPDIALKNSNLDYKELGVPSLNVKNQYDGLITWFPFHVFESTCSIDIKNFPFDQQTCYLKFQAWSYAIDEVEMVGGSKGIIMDYYEANSGWDIIDSSWSVDTETGDSTINFSIRLRRKPLFFMLSVIFPIIALAILNLCAFLLPNECGERAGYAITVFLAFAVFLTIVSSSLPQNSESVSLVAIFLIIQTTCSTLITILVLALLRLGSFDEKDEKVAVPRVLTFLMRKLKWKSRSKCSKVETEKDGKMHDSQSSLPDASESKVSRIEMPTQLHENRLFKESSTVDEFSWKEVVVFLDVVLFVIFAIILTASLIGCLVGAQRNAVN